MAATTLNIFADPQEAKSIFVSGYDHTPSPHTRGSKQKGKLFQTISMESLMFTFTINVAICTCVCRP